MNKYDVRIKKLNENAVIPTYGSEFAAGADLYACLSEPLTIEPDETAFVHTGLSVELPLGFAGLVYARSGLACKRDLAPANKVGVIDCDYRGEIMVALHNHGKTAQTIENGERLCQMVVARHETVDWEAVDTLDSTQRGAGGFGHTGTK